jgi:ABC-2 type transport system ATP-binding protein
MPPLLELKNVSKFYGDRAAVACVSIEVHAGETVGLIGPNGAGKTTTIKIALDLVRDGQGSVRLFDTDYATGALSIKRGLGYVPETVAPPGKLRIEEYVQYAAALQNIPARSATSAWQEFSRKLQFEVDPRAIIDTLSKGNQQKLVIVSSLLHRPRLWVLDEPMTGLDPTGMNLLKTLIDEYRTDGNAILISTHMLAFVESLCDRVYVLVGGHVVGEKTLRDKGGHSVAVSPIEAFYNEITEA